MAPTAESWMTYVKALSKAGDARGCGGRSETLSSPADHVQAGPERPSGGRTISGLCVPIAVLLRNFVRFPVGCCFPVTQELSQSQDPIHRGGTSSAARPPG